MKRIISILAAVIFVFGCARLSVQGSKEPIKVDISMRLDIYQHVQNDIDAIEGIVSGDKGKSVTKDNHSLLGIFTGIAYAEETLGPEVEQAALRRKNRLSDLHSLEGKGIVGENRMGLVEARDPSRADESARQLINAENDDRMVIYKSIAVKNNTSLGDVQKLYANRLSQDAPAGTPIEVLNSYGSFDWKIK